MSDRAVSEVVSYVLVFALVVSAVGIVSVSGLSTLQDTRNDEQMENAERAFSVLDDNLADVHRRNAPSRATELSLGQAKLETGANVTMWVNVTGSDPVNYSSKIRPLVYTGDEGRQLVYEAGAVFRTSEGGGVRVQDPPFVVSEDRVLISMVGLNRPDRQALSGSTVLVRARQRGQSPDVVYNSTAGGANSVTIALRGTSQPKLWRDYLQEVGFSSCSVSGDDVKCTFTPPSGSIEQTYVVYHDIAVSIES